MMISSIWFASMRVSQSRCFGTSNVTLRRFDGDYLWRLVSEQWHPPRTRGIIAMGKGFCKTGSLVVVQDIAALAPGRFAQGLAGSIRALDGVWRYGNDWAQAKPAGDRSHGGFA
jgi:hypothetical protein